MRSQGQELPQEGPVAPEPEPEGARGGLPAKSGSFLPIHRKRGNTQVWQAPKAQTTLPGRCCPQGRGQTGPGREESFIKDFIIQPEKYSQFNVKENVTHTTGRLWLTLLYGIFQS